MSPWLTKIRRRPVWSLGPVALLALAPKCLFCLLAYAGLGAALGLGGPEICGPAGAASGGWAPVLGLVTVALGVAGLRAWGWGASRAALAREASARIGSIRRS